MAALRSGDGMTTLRMRRPGRVLRSGDQIVWVALCLLRSTPPPSTQNTMQLRDINNRYFALSISFSLLSVFSHAFSWFFLISLFHCHFGNDAFSFFIFILSLLHQKYSLQTAWIHICIISISNLIIDCINVVYNLFVLYSAKQIITYSVVYTQRDSSYLYSATHFIFTVSWEQTAEEQE